MGIIEIPEHTTKLLQAPHPLHTRALELYEEGNLRAANTTFAEAAAASRARTIRLDEIVPEADDRETEIARDVAYGRVLLHWALSTEAQYRYDRDDDTKREMLQLAIGRASRGLVLLSQDQHCLVTPDELTAAQQIVASLDDTLTELSTSPNTPPATISTKILNESEAEIIRLSREASMLAA